MTASVGTTQTYTFIRSRCRRILGLIVICLSILAAYAPPAAPGSSADPQKLKFPEDDEQPWVRFAGTGDHGKSIVAVRWNGRVDTWDLETGKLRKSFRVALSQPVALSPDASLVASQDKDEGPLVIESTETGKEVGRTPEWPRPDIRCGCGAFSSDNRLLARVSQWGGGVMASEFAAGGWELAQSPPGVVHALRTETKRNLAVSFSPDNRLLANAGGHKTVEVWDLKEWKRVRVIHPDPEPFLIYWLGFSPDGKALAAGTFSSKVHLWDATNWKQVLMDDLKESAIIVWSGDFSPDGRYLAVTGGDWVTTKVWVMVWELATRRRIAMSVVVKGCGAMSVRFTPDADRLVLGCDYDGARVLLWDWRKEKLIRTYEAKEPRKTD